jgi:putative methionine-R-sulfoxide reductase with GAF domain
VDYVFAEKKIKDMVASKKDFSVLQNVVDFLYDNFDLYDWVGIYILHDYMLVLGSWHGEQATEHTKIPVGTGVCGSAAMSGNTEIVSDVSIDKRYLSCFVSTKSEIVVPIKRNGLVIGEIDIDSDTKNAFSKRDATFLERIANILSTFIL